MRNFRIFIGLTIIGALSFTFAIDDSKPQLVTYYGSECNSDLDPYFLIDRIIKKERIGDTTFLTLGFKENCLINFYPAINFENNVLSIRLDARQYGENDEKIVALCDCCFELTLVMTGIQDTNFNVKLEDHFVYHSSEPYQTYPETYTIYNGDTINKKNKYGLYEGVWIKFDESTGEIKYKEFYEPNFDLKPRALWRESYTNGIMVHKMHKDTSWSFDENGILSRITIQHKKIEPRYMSYFEEFTYYPNGKMKSHCPMLDYGMSSKPDSCIYWNEMGEKVVNK